MRALSVQKVVDFVTSNGAPMEESSIIDHFCGKKSSSSSFTSPCVPAGSVSVALKQAVSQGRLCRHALRSDLVVYWRGNEENLLKQDEEDKTKQAIEELSWVNGVYESQVKGYMEQLHLYNEVKDIAQEVLGKVANVEGETVSSLYPRYGLDEED